MQDQKYAVATVSIPQESRVTATYATTNLADAYSIELPLGTSKNPETLARFIFSNPPAWSSKLLKIRDVIVSVFGIKTAKQLEKMGAENKENRVGIFKIYEIAQNEIVLGEDDKHLDFRLSVLYVNAQSAQDKPHLVVSTVVHCHNNLWPRLFVFNYAIPSLGR